MRKLILFTALFFVTAILSHAQVYTSGRMLGGDVLRIGVIPSSAISNGLSAPTLYLDGAVRLQSELNLLLTYGAFNRSYLGAGLQWALLRNLSVSLGGHYDGNPAADAEMALSVPIANAFLHVGLDHDLIFNSGKNPLAKAWFPLGVELAASSSLSLLFECRVGVHNASSFLSAGVMLFL